jgi:hypothetical protein
MEASQRVRAGKEEKKVGVSSKNYAAPWVYAVVTFLHKDIFKKPIRLDWAGQFTKKTMKHMLMGRMSCLWAPRHKEAPMLVANIHQAGSAAPELQQQVWMALQGVRAKYPEAQGVLGGDSSTQMHQVTERDIRQATPVTCAWSTTNSKHA